MSVRPRSLVAVGFLALTACATSPEASGDLFRSGARREEGVLLTVQNQDFRDATIYVFWNGVRDRVGTVTGKTDRTFEMRWRGEEVWIEVDFVGGGGHRSRPISVFDGDHLEYIIRISGAATP